MKSCVSQRVVAHASHLARCKKVRTSRPARASWDPVSKQTNKIRNENYVWATVIAVEQKSKEAKMLLTGTHATALVVPGALQADELWAIPGEHVLYLKWILSRECTGVISVSVLLKQRSPDDTLAPSVDATCLWCVVFLLRGRRTWQWGAWVRPFLSEHTVGLQAEEEAISLKQVWDWGVVQWKSICLACLSPWVPQAPSPAQSFCLLCLSYFKYLRYFW